MSTLPQLTPRELEILQHALGADQYGRGERRNWFCAGDEDLPDCAGLVALGLMETFRREWLPYFNCRVTEKGRAAMLSASPKPPKLTKSQERYQRFLSWADAWGGSFRQFLQHEKGGAR